MVLRRSGIERPPATLEFAHTVSRMLIDCVRLIHADAHSARHLGASLEEMFVSFAVHVGTADGHPMSATKISRYLNIPRTNVLRALTSLEQKDIIYRVGNVYATNVDRLQERITLQLMQKQIKTVTRTWAELNEIKSSVLGE